MGGTDLYMKVVHNAGRRVKRLCVLFGTQRAACDMVLWWTCSVGYCGDTVYPVCLSSAFLHISLPVAGTCMFIIKLFNILGACAVCITAAELFIVCDQLAMLPLLSTCGG